MTLCKTELTTFAATQKDIDRYASWGIDHIILDHPWISIRSWQELTSYDHLYSLKKLLNYCKTEYPHIKCSVHCDIMPHDESDERLTDLYDVVDHHAVDYLRVQDPGILQRFYRQVPCIFDAQIGNSNWKSIEVFGKKAARQTLSMELPFSDIQLIKDKTDLYLDMVVYGRVLIQYSQRRFMTGFFDEKASSNSLQQIHKLAEDEDYPGRRFTFLDNLHGHCMFAYFDRSLLRDISSLLACNLASWIVDVRGEESTYQQAVVQAYRGILDDYNHHQKINNSKEYYEQVLAVAPRPLKPGFFRANQTDRRRYKNSHKILKDMESCVGTVIDTVGKSYIIIESTDVLRANETVLFRHPKMEDKLVTLQNMVSMDKKAIRQTEKNDLFYIPWFKGIQQQAIIVRTHDV